LDPRDDTAYFELGETYLKLRQGNDAFQVFSRAVSINPDNLKAQLKVGQILLLGKQTEEARKKAELILEKSPNNMEALSLIAGVQIQEKNIDSAFESLKKAISIDPNHPGTQLSLARLYVLNGEIDQAEQAYQKAISVDPSSRFAHVELSRLYARRGEWDKAETVLKEMIQASASKSQDLQILARFYESQKRWDQTEKTYLEAVDASPPGDVTALLNLGGYYARRQSYDKALEAVQKAAEIKEDDPNILVSIAHLHFDFKKFEDAEATVNEVLAKDNGNVSANYLKGRLYLLRKDFANARERFDLVVRERPSNAMAHYFRALTLIGMGEARLAQRDLLKAVELNPQMLDARLILAEFYLHDRNRELAKRQIEKASKLAPQDVRTLLIQGNLRILERDAKGAEEAFKEVVELSPEYAPGHYRLGLLYYLTARQEDALNSFQKALELDPGQTNALALMVGIYVRDKKFNEAFELCRRQKQAVDENPFLQAVIEYIEGNIFQARKDSDRALESFRKAIETDPNVLASYVALARMYGQLGKLDQAISQYEAVLNKNPNYLGGYMAIGTIYEQKGDGEKAETYYRKALEIKRDFAPAANNLAWNLADRGGNIDEALKFAQIAKEKMPKNPAVMDTLGWIYYLKGTYLNAIAELQDSVQLAPDNPAINYHLGMAYYKNNKEDGAKEFLEKALELDPNFKDAEEARKILNELKR
jgi:tetratricopeptide (TPR) repeat protein